MRYTDPSGHCANDDNPDDCIDTKKKYSASDFLDFTGYSTWERQILRKLYDEGGSNAVHGVDYILANNIHITVGEPFVVYAPNPNRDTYSGDWQSTFNVAGWYEGNDYIILDPQHNEVGKMPNNWDLSTIIHEAYHIEQGENLAKSVLGEMQAGQFGIDVYAELEGESPNNLDTWMANAYKATTVDAYHDAYEGQSYWWNLFILPCNPGEHLFCP